MYPYKTDQHPAVEQRNSHQQRGGKKKKKIGRPRPRVKGDFLTAGSGDVDQGGNERTELPIPEIRLGGDIFYPENPAFTTTLDPVRRPP